MTPPTLKAVAEAALPYTTLHDTTTPIGAFQCAASPARILHILTAYERMREALKDFYEHGCFACHGDCGSANPPISSCPMRTARDALASADAAMGKEPTCINHPDRPSRVNLDNEELCQECADAWARGEGDAAMWRERDGL